MTFNPDFGKEFTYSFTTGNINGIEELGSEVSINVYPNPTSQQISIDLKGINGQTNVSIFNHLGYKVFQEVIEDPNIISHSTILDMTEFVSGIYHVQIENGGKITTHKIVKI